MTVDSYVLCPRDPADYIARLTVDVDMGLPLVKRIIRGRRLSLDVIDRGQVLRTRSPVNR